MKICTIQGIATIASSSFSIYTKFYLLSLGQPIYLSVRLFSLAI